MIAIAWVSLIICIAMGLLTFIGMFDRPKTSERVCGFIGFIYYVAMAYFTLVFLRIIK